MPKVFQLVHALRDGEETAPHSPDFTMLEWCRGPGTLEDVLDDTVGLVRAVAAAVGNVSGIDVHPPIERVTCAQAFARAGIDLSSAIDETHAGDVFARRGACGRAATCCRARPASTTRSFT